MRCAVYQMDLTAGNPEANREKVARWMGKVCETQAPDVVVLPELWTTAYAFDSLGQTADCGTEPTHSFLSGLARRYGVHIVGGSVANREGDKLYNTALAFDREGTRIARYDKVHLVPMLDEPRHFTGGGAPPNVFDFEGVPAGMIICYDLRFPELARPLAVEGAAVLFVVAEWPFPREAAWDVLLRARAVENQLYVVAANRVGSYGGTTFCGMSRIIDPLGHVLAEASTDREETLTADLDLAAVAAIRGQVPVFASRVPKLYRRI